MFTVNIYKNDTKQTVRFATEQEASEAMQQAKSTLGYNDSAHMFAGKELVKTVYAY